MQNCNIIVIDNFYKNPLEVRNFALNEEYNVSGNYPGHRTRSFANKELKETIEKFVSPNKLTDFPMEPSAYNGSFQYATSRQRSWIHIDPHNNWGGVLFLTPDAPVNSGTAFYRLKKGYLEQDVSKYSQDLSKWELVDQVGNVFNRLVLFNSKRYHMSMDYFGTELSDSRLFQVFFFD